MLSHESQLSNACLHIDAFFVIRDSDNMTFLHTADWQMGKPFARIDDEQKRAIVRQERINVLSRIGVHAQEQKAEFILVAGDLFDSPSPDKATVSATCAAIGSLNVPVYAIPGNHDHGGPSSVWEQPFFIHERQALAPNLTLLLKAEALELDSVVLFPCPLLRRHETGDTTAWIRSTDFSAFGTKTRLVIAHGTVQDFGPTGDDEDAAMPANYLDLGRLPTHELDYIALGDWHGMKHINDKAWYSGTPEPDRFPRGEGNLPGHILNVSVGRGEIPTVTTLSTGRLNWHELEHTLSEESGLAALEKALTNDLSLGIGKDLLRLTLIGSLGISALTELESLLATWQSRLLRLRLHQHITISPTDEEIAALTQRTDAPLIARVAEKLIAQGMSDGESAEIARSALRQLHAALK
jgi:DNA repair exonuclease SbcCD nuclease subunit